MIIASITLPHWVTYTVTTAEGKEYSKHIGLHRSCSNGFNEPCQVFPTEELCSANGERYFCSMWRSVGFLASFSTILHLASIVTFLVIMGGGKYKRETGWTVLGGLLVFVAAIEFTLMGIVVSGLFGLLNALDTRARLNIVCFVTGISLRQRRAVPGSWLGAGLLLDLVHRERFNFDSVCRWIGHFRLCAPARGGLRVSERPHAVIDMSNDQILNLDQLSNRRAY